MEDYTPWKYTPKESLFLNIVNGCGGFFVPSQYTRFRGVKRGNAVQQLVSKGIRRKHLRPRKIGTRMLYRWLGIPPVPTTKVADTTIQRRLITLDFVLAHWGKWTFNFTKNNDPAFTKNGTPGVCFVENGASFEGWLESHKPLLTALGKTILMYVSPHERRIAAAKARIEQWLAHAQDKEDPERLNILKAREAAGEKLTRDEQREYRKLGFQKKKGNAPVGTQVHLKGWWEAGCTKHFNLFVLPPFRPSKNTS